MNQPRLYCICGKVMIDEKATSQPDSFECEQCVTMRCSKCMWSHLREKHPTTFLTYRNLVRKGTLTEGFKFTGAARP